jgi:hypothetical protein
MNAPSHKTLIAGIPLLVLTLLSFGLRLPAMAAPPMQLTPFPTPTPGPDGRIIYVVQPGDTLTRIALIAGVREEELRALNDIAGDTIFEGQELLLGLGGPSESSPTPGPSPTPTSAVPTPSPKPGSGNLCVLLYHDRNGDAIRQEEEPYIPGGAINVSNRSGTVSETADTAGGSDEDCNWDPFVGHDPAKGFVAFKELPEGEYTVSVAIPEGYNPTTETSYALTLKAGEETYLNFGAQPNSQNEAETPVVATEGGRSPLLGLLGGLFLLLSLGLGLYASRLVRGK